MSAGVDKLIWDEGLRSLFRDVEEICFGQEQVGQRALSRVFLATDALLPA